MGLLKVIGIASLLVAGLGIGAAHADPSAPEHVAKRVADRLVTETDFTLVPLLADGRQAGFYTIRFDDVTRVERGKTYLASGQLRIAADAQPSLAGLRLKLAHSAGAAEVWIDGTKVYDGATPTDLPLEELDYEFVATARSVAPLLTPSSRVITVRLRPSGDRAEFSLGFARVDGQTDRTSVAIVAPVANPVDPVRFLLAGPLADAQASAAVGREPSHEIEWRAAPPALGHGLSGALDRADWRYFSGAFLAALDDVTATFPALDYRAYADAHARFFLDNVDRIAAERMRGALHDGPFSHYFRFNLLDDVGPQSVALAVWGERGVAGADGARARAIANRAADHMMRSTRLADGTLARITPVDRTVWADDLFMGGASLARLSVLLARPELLDEAARQVLLFDKTLKDRATGLYWHGWFAPTRRPSASKWGRANGWTMMAKAAILNLLPAGHRDRGRVLAVFRAHAEALRRVQSSGGLWHQVLDNDQTYLETSASAMFVHAFAEGVSRGWLDAARFAPAARRGWQAVAARVAANGDVEGIVRSTPIMFSDQEYHARAPRTNDPRGIGAILQAATSMARLERMGRSEPAR